MADTNVLLTALHGGNAAFVADLYARWVQDKNAVDPGFAELFAAFNDDPGAIKEDASGAARGAYPSLIGSPDPDAKPPAKGDKAGAGKEAEGKEPAKEISAAQITAEITYALKALALIRAYREYGHFAAGLDPLKLQKPTVHPELNPAFHGLSEADLTRRVFVAGALGFNTATLQEIIAKARQVYCQTVGFEFAYLTDPVQRQWFIERLESKPLSAAFDQAGKKKILSELTKADSFEVFCQKRYVGVKRFGLEGTEAMIPALHAIIDTAAADKAGEVVIGMAHRGRLNTLVHVAGKPLQAMFSEFAGVSPAPEGTPGAGDVKYHHGYSSDITVNGQKLHVSLQPNPSHLEVADAVVIGKVRARQDMAEDRESRRSVLGILIHGDFAFAGQGVVYETMGLGQFQGYETGGTVHIIANNQIGFTGVPRPTHAYILCTDLARAFQAPVLHVNADDPEAVVFCAKMAAEFRQTFGVDVVLDIIGYRRHGHNEADEPAFTQPLMYRVIAKQPTARQLYTEKLVKEGTLSAAEAEAEVQAYMEVLDKAFEAGKTYRPNKADCFEGHWTGFTAEYAADKEEKPTAVKAEVLQQIGRVLTEIPADFMLNNKIARQLDAKKVMLEKGEGIDWGTAEALAFGSILLDGFHIRLSGEDSQRGTFSHRHAVWTDQQNEKAYTPLAHIAKEQGRIDIYNSLLSEMGVLGFEYGYSLADPRTLTIWEAQFGDFANEAQVIFDQFISAGESKWLRQSGLVMLLPHGFEGQGSEHSSARLERYLQLCAERNMIVCNFTVPANYFHALRRQMCRNFRKPLIVMSPKSLLRHKAVISELHDFTGKTHFLPVIADPEVKAAKAVKKVILCSGKVYYDLQAAKEEKKITDTALIRLEQLYPFPEKELAEVLQHYPQAKIIWCQEEPQNMGAWNFIDRRIEKVLVELSAKHSRAVYVGREESASPAVGSAKLHQEQQKKLVEQAFSL